MMQVSCDKGNHYLVNHQIFTSIEYCVSVFSSQFIYMCIVVCYCHFFSWLVTKCALCQFGTLFAMWWVEI